MVITFLLPTFARLPGGGYRVVYEYSNQLSAIGHEINVVHLRKLPNVKLREESLYSLARRQFHYGRDLVWLPRKRWMRIDPKVNLIYLRWFKPSSIPKSDVIFATYWATAELINNLSVRAGRKFYLIQSYETWGGPKERVDKTWLMPFKKVVISKELYAKAIDFGLPREDVTVIPNGIDQSLFRVIKPIEKRDKNIVMLFSEAPVKGGVDGINALKTVKAELPDLNATLFGITRRKKKIPGWIQYFRNPEKGMLVEEIYNNGSIYLCPSLYEGWGLPPAEAMACGCAVVSTNNPGVQEYCVNNKNALLSEIGKPHELANNIVYLLRNDQVRIEIAKKGNETIKKYTWEKSAKKLEEYMLTS
jgi:glycosyltransferase involved in cell wall biosynthesis